MDHGSAGIVIGVLCQNVRLSRGDIEPYQPCSVVFSGVGQVHAGTVASETDRPAIETILGVPRHHRAPVCLFSISHQKIETAIGRSGHRASHR